MKHFGFTSYLTSNLNVNEADVAALVANCPKRKVLKNEVLLQAGQTCTHSFFVEKGLLRQFYADDKGKEHLLHFAPENWFVTDRESVFFKEPSQYTIQALEESRVLVLDDDFVHRLGMAFPGFRDFNERLLHNHIRQLQRRITLLQAATAKERYLQFVQTYPDVLLRVPQAMVASYLGIAPESLSRVRRDLASQNSSVGS